MRAAFSGSVAEWSKALDLGSSHFDGVGSNPTAASTSFSARAIMCSPAGGLWIAGPAEKSGALILPAHRAPNAAFLVRLSAFWAKGAAAPKAAFVLLHACSFCGAGDEVVQRRGGCPLSVAALLQPRDHAQVSGDEESGIKAQL